MNDRQWLYCPRCGGKTRVMLDRKTILKHFPLFCPKCKKETTIDVIDFRLTLCNKV